MLDGTVKLEKKALNYLIYEEILLNMQRGLKYSSPATGYEGYSKCFKDI